MQGITYLRADSAEAAVAAFAAAGGSARYIAGGTTLYDLMKLGVETPAQLIDLSRIAGMDTITESADGLRIGAMALMADVAAAPVVRDGYPVLAESLLKAASQQLRNMATVGGNVLQRTRCPYFRNGAASLAAVGTYPCNKRVPGSGCGAIGGLDRGQAVLGSSDACSAVAAGDWPVALMAMEARLDLLGPDGARSVPVAEFYLLPGQTPHQEFALLPGEIIMAITVPQAPSARTSAYQKLRDRESFAFALASAAVVLDMEGDAVRSARIALGGVATVPWRATAAEVVLAGRVLTEDLAREAGRAAFAEAHVGQANAVKIELGQRVVADALMVAAGRRV